MAISYVFQQCPRYGGVDGKTQQPHLSYSKNETTGERHGPTGEGGMDTALVRLGPKATDDFDSGGL
jgi:hypothetical protein